MYVVSERIENEAKPVKYISDTFYVFQLYFQAFSENIGTVTYFNFELSSGTVIVKFESVDLKRLLET